MSIRVPWIKWFVYALGGLCLMSLLNGAIGFLALKRLEKKAGSPIRGHFIPHLLSPVFTLKNPDFQWQERFQIHSGTLTVHYDPSFIIPSLKFHVHLRGQDLGGRLLGELAESQGLSEVKLDRVEADLAFSKEENPEIFLLDIRSPVIRFHLSRNPEEKIEIPSS